MNSRNNSDDATWTARLKSEAESRSPQFSPSLHNRIMYKALYSTAGIPSVERATHRWFFLLAGTSSLAAAAIILLLGISAWTHLQPPEPTQPTPSAAEINISALFPDPGRLIQQTATRWQNQFSKQTFADFQSPAQQLSRYVVRKIALF